MRGFANAEGVAGRVRGAGCWLPRDALEGVLVGRLLLCWLEVEWEFRGVRLARLGAGAAVGDAGGQGRHRLAGALPIRVGSRPAGDAMQGGRRPSGEGSSGARTPSSGATR